MQQVVAPMTQEEIDHLSKQLSFAEQRLGLIVEGAQFQNAMEDLDLIQQGLDSGEITDTIDLQCLGVPFGQLFINFNEGFGWWTVEDELGRAPCIRYQETDLLLYPLTLISKRIEQGEKVDVRTLFSDLSRQLTEISQQLDAGQAP